MENIDPYRSLSFNTESTNSKSLDDGPDVYKVNCEKITKTCVISIKILTTDHTESIDLSDPQKVIASCNL